VCAFLFNKRYFTSDFIYNYTKIACLFLPFTEEKKRKIINHNK